MYKFYFIVFCKLTFMQTALIELQQGFINMFDLA